MQPSVGLILIGTSNSRIRLSAIARAIQQPTKLEAALNSREFTDLLVQKHGHRKKA